MMFNICLVKHQFSCCYEGSFLDLTFDHMISSHWAMQITLHNVVGLIPTVEIMKNKNWGLLKRKELWPQDRNSTTLPVFSVCLVWGFQTQGSNVKSYLNFQLTSLLYEFQTCQTPKISWATSLKIFYALVCFSGEP